MGTDPMKSKVVLLGDGGVGKTSLIRRFVVDQYSDDYITTVGTKVSKRSLNLGHDAAEVEISMQIWDVLGQKRIQRRPGDRDERRPRRSPRLRRDG
jgi:GTPase SAR1 family protein